MNVNGLFRALHALAERQLNDRLHRFLVNSPLFQRFAVESSRRAGEVVRKVADAAVKAAEFSGKSSSSSSANHHKK